MSPPISPLAPKSFPALPEIAGVTLAAVEAGLRYRGRPDLMLVRLAPGTSMAGVFTRSSTRSPPVIWSATRIEERRHNSSIEATSYFWTAARIEDRRQNPSRAPAAILANAGNANAFTGKAGTAAVQEMAQLAAEAIGCKPADVFLASTGVIGEPLDTRPIRAAMPGLASGLGPGHWEAAARAIMTTDTFPKGAGTDTGGIRIAGIAKGSGMIAPNLATMLAFVFTDAAVAPPLLQELLVEAVGPSFNSITVDGDRSTSDTMLLAATGAAGGDPITDITDPRAESLRTALTDTLCDLAQQIVRDGEGATKFVEIAVEGADNETEARSVAFAVANSPLVKTAIAGEDPNWGRIVAALGNAEAHIDLARLAIRLGTILVTRSGAVAPDYAEAAGAAYMKNPEIEIGIDLGLGGTGRATVWTCDLSARYVEINADYRS